MVISECFRKLMGWCPNAKTLEARQHVNLENFNSDVPDRSRGEGGDTKSMGWLRKASTPILLFDIFFTLVYFLVLNRIGLNLMIFLLVGFSVIVHTAFYWKSQMQRYNDLVKQPVTEYSNKKKWIILTTSFVLYFLTFFLSIIIGHEHAFQTIFSFGGGFLIGMWLVYFQIIYWEKKNHKMIYREKSYSMWKHSYIIRERK
jgi:hypothetical protein